MEGALLSVLQIDGFLRPEMRAVGKSYVKAALRNF